MAVGPVLVSEEGRPIADYALLADGRSAALVSGAGSVDWLCLPRFDSPSCFGRILDEDAGHWFLRPSGPHDARRRYLPGTMVLETQFDTPTGMAMLTDAMVFGEGERGHEIGRQAPHVLVRVVEVTRGSVAVEGAFAPRPEYGLVRAGLRAVDGAVVSWGGAETIVLAGPAPLAVDDGTATWHLELEEGDRVGFALQHGTSWDAMPVPWSQGEIGARLDDTVAGWVSWSVQHEGYEGQWVELVRHSARVLRGLTFQPTGAIVAAPTTSLGAQVGGGRNGDYRYSWLRDASTTMQALWVAACPGEARQLVDWLVVTAGSTGTERDVQIVYGVGGEHDLSERQLDHLAGWRGGAPVRAGNDAWRQVRLDVYGELLDSVFRLRDAIGVLDVPAQSLLRSLADTAARRWTETDHGMWEPRGEPRHHLYSKLMCWVALDRAVIMADWFGADDAQAAAWASGREDIRRVILEEAWNDDVGAYTQVLGADRLDAAALCLALYGFLPVDDARMAATIERIATDLSAPCGLLWRDQRELDGEPGDGVGGSEATFVLCTYWLVQCYAMASDVDRATELFGKVTAYANDVGLLAEQVDPGTGELLGNFPQAVSHVGLINAAWAITEATARRP